jgi:hypothetical protein
VKTYATLGIQNLFDNLLGNSAGKWHSNICVESAVGRNEDEKSTQYRYLLTGASSSSDLKDVRLDENLQFFFIQVRTFISMLQ